MSEQTTEQTQSECPPFVVRVTEEHDDGVTLEVTEEDYQRDLTAGIPADELMKPGKHRFRRVSPERVAKFRNSRPHQFYITARVRLDEDVYGFLKERAEKQNVDLFETIINQELRRAMEREQAEQNKIEQLSPVARELINDESFINLLKEKLRTHKDDLREAA